jgi:hypothetical protein
MSIYRQRNSLVPETDVTAPIPPEKAAVDIPPEPRRAESESQWVHLRKANPANIVLPKGRKWIDELPSHLRPIHLIEQFPRIVNLIALDWNDASATYKRFDTLLVDHRGGRRGFPAAVQCELEALRDHYFGICRAGQAPLV